MAKFDQVVGMRLEDVFRDDELYTSLANKVLLWDIADSEGRAIPRDERIVVQMLLENNGKVNQYEVTRLPDMNKVRSHRVIDKLVKRGVVKKEKIGKINRIVLVEE